MGNRASADLELRCCGSAGPDGIGAEGDPITVTVRSKKKLVRAVPRVYGARRTRRGVEGETNQKAVRVQADCVQRR